MALDRIELEQLGMACALRWPTLRELLARGMPRGFLVRLLVPGDLGMARVSLRNALWEPEGDLARLIVAVRCEDGGLIDQLALAPTDPDRWALRTGDGWALGLEHFRTAQVHAPRQARDERIALRLFSTPLAWLLAGGAGICVLDWSASALAQLRGLGPGVALLADDAAAAERLREALKWGGLPEVRVAGSAALRPLRQAQDERERKAA